MLSSIANTSRAHPFMLSCRLPLRLLTLTLRPVMLQPLALRLLMLQQLMLQFFGLLPLMLQIVMHFLLSFQALPLQSSRLQPPALLMQGSLGSTGPSLLS